MPRSQPPAALLDHIGTALDQVERSMPAAASEELMANIGQHVLASGGKRLRRRSYPAHSVATPGASGSIAAPSSCCTRDAVARRRGRSRGASPRATFGERALERSAISWAFAAHASS
jgi:hypothetical protein